MSYDLGTAHGKITLEYTGGREAKRAEEDIEDIRRAARKADGQLRKLASGLAEVTGKALLLGGLAVGLTNGAAAAAAMAVQVAGIVPELASLGALAATLPALLTAGAVAGGVLAAALVGVADAAKAAFEEDPAKFNEAIKALSPQARQAAQAFRDMVPALRRAQQGIQDAFFSNNFEDLFPRVERALGTLRPGLQGVAKDLGGMGVLFGRFATSSRTIDFVSATIARLRVGLAQMSVPIQRVLIGLREVGTVGLGSFSDLMTSIANATDSFGSWLQVISGSGGQLQGWIDTAKTTLGSLGDIAGNVGGILKSIFVGAQASGGGLLNTIAAITGEFNTFLASAGGQEAMRSLFTGILEVARQLSPVFTTLAGALAGALGPALQSLAVTLGPVLLQAVQALAPALGPLAQGLADILGAIGPILPVAGHLAGMLGTLLGGALTNLAAAIGPVAGLLGGALATAFQTLAPLITELATRGLPMAVQFGAQLMAAFAPLAPVIISLAQALLTSLVPVLPQLFAAAEKLLPVFVQLATVMSTELVGAITALIPMIPTLVNAFVTFLPIMVSILTLGLRLVAFFASLPGTLMAAVGAVVAFGSALISGIGNGIRGAYNVVVSVGSSIVGWFLALPGRVGAAIAALPSVLLSLAQTAMQRMLFAVGFGIGTIVSLATGVPGRVSGAMASLGSAIASVATRAWSAVQSAFSSGIASAVGFARALPGRVSGAIAALPGLLIGVATRAWAGLRSAFSSGIGAAASLAASLPGRISAAVGNLGGLLVGAGRAAVQGLISGIQSMVGAAAAAARNAASAVANGIRSALKISSPSRVMHDIGVFIGRGLVRGMLSTQKTIRAASDRLARLLVQALDAEKISRAQRSNAQTVLTRGTSALIGAANARESVVARLKKAQSALAAVEKQYNDAAAAASTKIRESFQLITNQPFVSVDFLKKRLSRTLETANAFARDMAALAKRGLNKDMLAQLAEAGPQAGAATARALANATDQQLKDLNTLAGQLGKTAASVGTSVANSLYGAGLRAAQGLVKGLQSQQKNIEALMLRIAKGMEAAIKRALRIKSPSLVMVRVGTLVMEGLIGGIERMQRSLSRTADAVTNVVNGIGDSAIAPTANGSSSTTLAGIRPQVTVNTAPAEPAYAGPLVQQTIHALPGMNATSMANYATRRLLLALQTGVSAVSLPVPLPQGA